MDFVVIRRYEIRFPYLRYLRNKLLLKGEAYIRMTQQPGPTDNHLYLFQLIDSSFFLPLFATVGNLRELLHDGRCFPLNGFHCADSVVEEEINLLERSPPALRNEDC